MDIKEIVAKRLDLKGLLIEDLYDGLIVPELEKLVAKSDNDLDDGLLLMIKPVLRDALEKVVDANVAKYLAGAEEPVPVVE